MTISDLFSYIPYILVVISVIGTIHEAIKSKDFGLYLLNILKKKFPGQLRQLEMLPILARISSCVSKGVRDLSDNGHLERFFLMEKFFKVLLKAGPSEVSDLDKKLQEIADRYGN